MSLELFITPKKEFERLGTALTDKYTRLAVFADMCRLNTLSTVKLAGSGHLGSSFSAMDIVTWLFCEEMNIRQVGVDNPNRDIYFSSKGHDVPGLYAVFYALGLLDEEKFLKLRRLGGTFGHPDVRIPGLEANSGSLGMGISKAKGMALAKKMQGFGGRVFVLLGDGELQEGQIYEGLQTAIYQKVNNLTVIVDHNKVQSDKPVAEIGDLGDLVSKIEAFGWFVERIDGHDYRQIESAFRKLEKVSDCPKMIIADTIKGCGVSFMEHPQALKDNNGLYLWHSGAPDDASYEKGRDELLARINKILKTAGRDSLEIHTLPYDKKATLEVKEYVSDAFGDRLVELGRKHKNLVVLDADLSSDCRLRKFEAAFPERFIECGIAEQDMVSTAGGLALQGMLPVCSSFAVFLASRANEQIYTNFCENTKIIYVDHYAGLIPAGPGQSHQSVRDISLFSAFENMDILQPCNPEETAQALTYCVETARQSSMIRLIIGPSPRQILLKDGYVLEPGKGCEMTPGVDAVLITYGPVMLNEALLAAEILSAKGFALKVINMPWLNRVDPAWLKEALGDCRLVSVLEDHVGSSGLGVFLTYALSKEGLLQNRRIDIMAPSWPLACGTPDEVLHHHRLDGASVADRILALMDRPGI
jgi:transketolase